MEFLIFGGEGFIGSHLVAHLHNNDVPNSNIFSLDIKKNDFTQNIYSYLDVRQAIQLNLSNNSGLNNNRVVFDLAAIHRSQGHSADEFYKTNVIGAENISNFARQNNIYTIIFISSIAVYGTSENCKDEETIPQPNTPYGISKLQAEKIYRLWQAELPDKRKLIILRPGVVFGNGENGNFEKLYQALNRKIFFFPGRKDTIKAAVYVKDLARLLFELAKMPTNNIDIFNVSFFPAPTLENICKSIASVNGLNMGWKVLPGSFVKIFANLICFFQKIVGTNFLKIHPSMVSKLMISTNVSAEKLAKSDHKLHYDLKSAIEDWVKEKQEVNI